MYTLYILVDRFHFETEKHKTDHGFHEDLPYEKNCLERADGVRLAKYQVMDTLS
jgi:hypothetical protein